jgi:magnesium-transporting ATPase (P-type)
MQVDHKSDYLEGRLILMSIVITFITPVLYLSFIKRKADENVELHGLTDPTVDIVAWQLPCVWFQAVSVFLLVFVSFRFSPWPNNKSLNKVWMFVIPKLQLLCVIFVLIPIFLICKSFSNFDAIQSSPYKAALWLQCMLSIYLLPWIFMQIAGLVRAAIGRYQKD